MSSECRAWPLSGIEKNMVAVRNMVPHGAGQDIARRKFRPGHALEKSLAGFIDQGSTFASHSLADQRHRAFWAVKRGRVELNEFEVG
ncbi:hypothetical protein X751_00165 [Mesorhizobium sp. LNJC395A00]|nr:hypothetical protein X751_00165 [Mesorhizobium sp. LNJC395A00]